MAKGPGVRPRRQPLARAAATGIPAQAQAELDPIIAAITGAANRKAAASEAAIKGYTDAYAHQLAGEDFGAPYAGAESQTAAVDAALQQALATGGTDLASQLAARMSQLDGSSGQVAVQQAGQALAGQGAGAGTARLASGSAALNALIGEAANARAYGKKMPANAKLSGLAGLKQAEGNAQQEIAQGTLQTEQNLPTIENELRSAKQAQRALASENAYRNAEISLSAQRNALSAQRAQVSAQQGQERINIESARAAQSALNENRSYRLALARVGISQKSLQLRMATEESKLKGGGFTPSEKQHLDVTAAQIARGAFSGVAATHYANGSVKSAGLPALNYKQAMLEMAKEGIPPSIAAKELRLAGYKPGFRGTPSTDLQKTLEGIVFNGGGAPSNRTQAALVNLAHQYMGTPYVWGGESPKGFDCSGFAQYLYGKVGIRIPRTTYTQWQTGHAVPNGQLQPGDLVFFRGSDSRGGLPGHVGIYIGGGKMIDAPHTGADVRIESVASFGGYMGARRYGKG